MNNLFKAQLLTMIFSWSIALAFIILGGSIYSPFFVLFMFAYMAAPGLIALHFYNLEKMRVPFKFKWNKSLILPVVLPLLLGSFTLLISLPFSELRNIDYICSNLPSFLSHFTPFTMIFLFCLIALVITVLGGLTIYFLIALGPELMWIGYMWDKAKFFGFWKTSILIGVFKGLWFAPLILMGYAYPDHPFLGVLWIILACVSLSPWKLYLRLQTQSVIGSAIFNGTLSAFSAISVFLFTAPNYLLIGMGGVTGFISCILFNLLLFLKVRKNPLLEYEI